MAATAEPLIRRAETQVVSTPANSRIRIPLGRDADGNERGLTDEQIVDQIRRLRQESIDRNRRMMATALTCWEQYRNEMDFSDKASWESRVTLAKAHAAVKHATANMLRLLTQSQQWVQVEDIEELNGQQSFAPFVEKGVLKLADLAEFKEVLRDSLEYSFATLFGAIKVIWQHNPYWYTSVEQGEGGLQTRSQQILAGQLGLYSLDPWKVHFGPRTKGGSKRTDFIIEDSDADISDLMAMGGFENLQDFVSRDHKPSSKDDPSEMQRRGQMENANESRVRRRIELWDYWGDIIDPMTQEVVAREMHVLIGNGEKVIKFGPNPLWDKKPPYILFSPLIVAGRFPGSGILEMNIEVKKAIDRIAQMWETKLHFDTIPMYEVETAALENPEELATGVYPGKVFRKKMGQGANQIIRPLLHQPMGPDSFNTVIAFDKEYQRGTFVSESVQGLIDAKGETTATEVQQTVLASTLILSDVAMHIESECLGPLGEMIWDRMFQFMDLTSRPNWTQLVGGEIGQVLDQLPTELRVDLVRGQYVFRARGLSRVIEQQQQRQRLIEWVTTVSQLGPAQAIINLPILFKRVHDSFHLPDGDNLLAPNWQAIFQQLQLALLAQANPLAQQEMKQESTMEQIEAETDQVVAQEAERGKQAILREAAKAALTPRKESKEKK